MRELGRRAIPGRRFYSAEFVVIDARFFYVRN